MTHTTTTLFLLLLLVTSSSTMAHFQKVRTQFIAALADPQSTSGTGAASWGIWRVDPGPRGVRLDQAQALIQSGTAPAQWKYDASEFWLEEHGLIMEKPDFPLPPGKYQVTGGRHVTTVLTVAEDGDHWQLDDGAKLHDVTHLPCRSAKYVPDVNSGASAANADPKDYPVTPGAAMPDVSGCSRQDYWVVFVQAIEVPSATDL